MTYVQTEWVDDSAPDIDADHLNKIEQGVYDAHVGFAAAQESADAASSDAASAVSTVNGHVASVSNPHATTAKQVGARHHKNAKKRGAVGNGSTDDTAILQLLLDEIRDAGGGELYLPNDGNTIYRTRGLWVPANCRIVSDGADVYFWDAGDPRDESPDGDLRCALGFHAAFQRPNRGGASFTPSNVVIEGLVIDCANSGFQNSTALFPTNNYYTYWEANPFGADPNRKPSNVYPASSLRGLVPVNLAGDEMTLRDVKIIGTGYDAIQLSGNRITLERVNITTGARRNNVSVFSGTELEFYKLLANNCLAAIPTARTVNSSWVFNEPAPGCGVEIEPFATVNLEAVRFRDCTMKGNGGAGIGVVLDEGGTSTIDGLVIDGCYLAGNGASGATGVLKGAVELRGGNGSHAVFISNSSLKSSVRGSGVDRDAHGFAPKVIVSGCDLRFNSGGAASASGYVDGGGNVTA